MVVQRVPCVCAQCMCQLKQPWLPNTELNQQPQQKQNKSCEKWEIIECENDWELGEMKFLNTQHEEEASPEVQHLVLEDRAEVITMKAKKR